MDLAEPKIPNALSALRDRLGYPCALLAVYCGPGVAEKQLRDELTRISGSGLAEGDGPVNYVLIPTENDEDVLRRAGELRRGLSVPSWVAATRWRRAEAEADRWEVRDVIAIAVASGRPPGVYRVTDLPVEYAVLRQPGVVRRLVEIISPIVDQPMLRAAVESLKAADGNRSKASVDIGVHHSTLGYRLRRIRELTGMDPTSARDLTVLSIAFTVHAAVHGEILHGLKTCA